jgi:2-polyprenyl-3-methyl-5-hydroxy-6-metoxy-1,4-benzoquinol methylase
MTSADRLPHDYYTHERPEIARLVPAGARHVVDVGCGAGALGAALKRARAGIQVRGVEPVRSQADAARASLDDVLCGTAEDPLPACWPEPDCVLFADVLEHLVDPWQVLRTWRARLRAGGCVIASVPNALHWTARLAFARGHFDYERAGLLDRTHLRFFTPRTAVELVEGAGLRVTHFERVLTHYPKLPWPLPDPSGRIDRLVGQPPRGAGSLREAALDLATLQTLLVAS